MTGFLALVACTSAIAPHAAGTCDDPNEIREATLATLQSFVQSKKMKVLTFTGYSGAQYQEPEAMLERAARVRRWLLVLRNGA